MAVFKKFERSQATKYNNSLHAAYHTAQLKQLQAVGEEHWRACMFRVNCLRGMRW